MIVIFGLCFLLIDWLSFEEGGEGFHLKLDVQDQAGGRSFDLDEQGGRWSWKLGNFLGRHMCIILYQKSKKIHTWVPDLQLIKGTCNLMGQIKCTA